MAQSPSSPSSDGAGAFAGTTHRLIQALVYVAPVVAFAVLAWRARTVVDDAFINFRIVENILEGAGPVYNPGERVEAGTSPAWLLVLAVLARVCGPLGVSLPWIAVAAGVAAGTAALAVAQSTALHVWRRIRDADARWPHLALPAGSWLVVAVPPFAQFVASGLETGLALLWIAASVRAVVGADGGVRRAWRAVLVGLGPLVRPEFAVIAAPLLLALLASVPRQSPDGTRRRMARPWAELVAWAAALPVAAELFRMGYYATLVPNTALAKEAFEAVWSRGLVYLRDFWAPYWLAVPLLPLGVMIGRLVLRTTPPVPRWGVMATVVGGALSGAYVVRVGGDFMHARMFLPGVFALVVPVSLWPVRPRRHSAAFSLVAQVVLLVLLPAWAVVCGAWLRVPYQGEIGGQGIADEPGLYRASTGHPNPVEVADFRAWPSGPVPVGERLRALAGAGRRVLVLGDEQWPLAEGPRATVVTDGIVIGVAGVTAGPAVHFADTVGLTDPVASRLRLDTRGRAGHEKDGLRDWLVGRFVAAGALEDASRVYPQAGDARAALACGPLRELVTAVTAPMTAMRFLRNVAAAPRLTTLRIPAQPREARRVLCEGG